MNETTPRPTVIAAAIKDDTGAVWSVPRPGRHHNVIKYMRDSGYLGPVGGSRQGFVLSDGSFCGRVEAKNVAVEAGQIISGRITTGMLMSEDVW